jgi:hypothetical protein
VLPFGFEEKGDQGLAKAGATRVSATMSFFEFYLHLSLSVPSGRG